MFVRTYGAASRGVDVLPVSVELRSGRGIQFHVAGMTGSLARDAFLRIRGALQAEGWGWPRQALTISLSPGHASLHPADLDLPLALVVLAQIGVLSPTHIASVCSVGSLGLDGTLRGHPSSANASIAAHDAGCTSTLVPADILHASSGSRMECPLHGAHSLREVVDHLTGKRALPRWLPRAHGQPVEPEVPFESLRLSEHALTGLLLAAAGEHHVLFLGSPGTGKSTAARALHGILPLLNKSEAQTTRRLHAAKGIIRNEPLHPPMRTPHSGSGAAALIGSQASGRYSTDGAVAFLPGELSLAHRGLLLLDELPEWSRPAIEALRVPLEQGVVDLARAAGTTQLPAQCLVAATANPCPCGYFLDSERRCRCTPAQVRNYLKRLSGPLVDRFPIHLETVTDSEAASTMTTADARERVMDARKCLTAEAAWEAEARNRLDLGVERWRFSGRARVALLGVARTHAALHQRGFVRAEDVDAALGYRVFDRAGWLEAAWDPQRPKHRR